MPNMSQNVASKIPCKEIPEGKENARPHERARLTRRKSSYSSCCELPARQPRVSLAVNDERKKEANGPTVVARAFQGKKTPFRIHCDERNVANNVPANSVAGSSRSSSTLLVSAAKQRVKNDDRKQVIPRPNDGSRKELRSQVATGVRGPCPCAVPRITVSNVGGQCPCNGKPQLAGNQLAPTKIPRRSRSTSEQPKNESYLRRQRSSSTETVAPPTTASTKYLPARVTALRFGARPPLPTLQPKRNEITDGSTTGQLRFAANPVQARGSFNAPGNASTPLDGPSTSLLSVIALKGAVRRSKSYEVEDRREDQAITPTDFNGKDPCDIDLIHHEQYKDDLPAAERERELRAPQLSPRFLMQHINAEQRKLVVMFLLRIGTHCSYPSFIVYQSVKMFDAAMDRIRVDTTLIQLIALASLWISLKKEQNFHKIPTAKMIVSLAKELYLGREDLLIAYERKILQALNFNITFPDAYTLYAHYLLSCIPYIDVSPETSTFLYHCGSYALDITLLDEQFCRSSVELITVTSVELVLGLAIDTATGKCVTPRWLFWRGILFGTVPQLYGRFQDTEIDETRIAILRRIINSGKRHQGFDVVFKKYSRSRYGRMAEAFMDRVNRVSISETFYDP